MSILGPRGKVDTDDVNRNPRGLAVKDDTAQTRVTRAVGNRGRGRKVKESVLCADGSIRRKWKK